MRQLYHVTASKNVPNILKQGLIPSLGTFSQDCGETKKRVYLFPSKADMEDALCGWLGDMLVDFQIDHITALKVEVDDNFPIEPGEVEYENYAYITIPPDCIHVLKTE